MTVVFSAKCSTHLKPTNQVNTVSCANQTWHVSPSATGSGFSQCSQDQPFTEHFLNMMPEPDYIFYLWQGDSQMTNEDWHTDIQAEIMCMPEMIHKNKWKNKWQHDIRYNPLWPCIFFHIFLKLPHWNTICCHNVFYCGVLVLVICPHSFTWLTRHQPSVNLKAHWF